jgi:hypothetical protein
MNIPYTPTQFAKAMQGLRSSSQVSVDSSSNDTSGAVSTQYVNFSYTYDGATLVVTITKKNGMAKFTSDSYVYGKISVMLGAV